MIRAHRRRAHGPCPRGRAQRLSRHVDALSVVINAAVRIGADLVEMFDRAAEVATPEIAEALRCVLQEYLKDGNSSLMGHRAYDDPEGLTYR